MNRHRIKTLPLVIWNGLKQRPNLQKIAENIGWLFFDKILRMGVGIFVVVWIARYLGPGQFGLLNFATAFVGLFGVISTFGLQGIVVRDIVRDPDCKEETLGTSAALNFVGGLVAYALILAVIFWLRPHDTLAKALVAILGSMMLFKVSDIAIYWFESQVQSKYVVWVQNGTFLLFAAVKIGLILHHARLIAFALANMVEAFMVALILSLVLGLYGPKLRQLKASIGRAKTLLKDSWPLMLSGIAIMIYMRIDQIMLGQMIGDEAVGIYSAAVRISEVWYFIPMAIVASLFPSIINYKKQGKVIYYQHVQKLFDLMVILSISLALLMTFLSNWVVILLFGTAYQKSGHVLAVHIWAGIFVFLGVASGTWFLIEGLQKYTFYRTLLGAVINIGLNLLMIPKFGTIGAAYATVISYAIAAMFSDLLQKETRHIFRMKLRAFNILRIAISI